MGCLGMWGAGEATKCLSIAPGFQLSLVPSRHCKRNQISSLYSHFHLCNFVYSVHVYIVPRVGTSIRCLGSMLIELTIIDGIVYTDRRNYRPCECNSSHCTAPANWCRNEMLSHESTGNYFVRT